MICQRQLKPGVFRTFDDGVRQNRVSFGVTMQWQVAVDSISLCPEPAEVRLAYLIADRASIIIVGEAYRAVACCPLCGIAVPGRQI